MTVAHRLAAAAAAASCRYAVLRLGGVRLAGCVHQTADS